MGMSRCEIIRFGTFELDLSSGELTKNGIKVKLQDQPLQILITLLERPGETVTREELRKRLWADDVYVSFEQNLNRAVNKLRDALGDSADNPRFIQTLPRRGYRFIAPTEKAASSTSNLASQAQLQATPKAVESRRGYAGVFQSTPVLIGVLSIVVLSTLILWRAISDTSLASTSSSINSIAVLPLEANSSDHAQDFLRVALADEVATYLSSLDSIVVRPSAKSLRYSGGNASKAANDLKARYVIEGHYQSNGSQVTVTLQAVDGRENRVVWGDSVGGTTDNMLDLRDRIRERLRNGLLPALSLPPSGTEVQRTSRNGAAYDLYLRSIAFSHDGAANDEAVQMLERAVGLDPMFAAAWEKLGKRLEYQHVYARGGELPLERAERAYERAFQLDPNIVSAGADLTLLQTESGDLGRAYARARSLVQSHPNSAEAHFALSYVLRYGGALANSAQECEAARKIDPANYMLRTCAQTFIRLGDYKRAADYIHLDAGSDWAEGMMLQVYLRTGDLKKALNSVRPISGLSAPLIRACIERQPQPTILRLSQAEENFPVSDPEARYHVGVVDAFCGLEESAARLLIAAAQRNYCPAEELERDPILSALRQRAEFQQVRQAARSCRERFNASISEPSA